MVDFFSARECQCIRQYVEQNKDTYYKKWLIPELENEETLAGTQGACGILKLLEKPEFKLMYKISLREDFVIDNEYNTLKTLEDSLHYCIHTPKVYALLKVRTPLLLDPSKESLFKSAETMVTRKILLQQYVKHIGSLYEFILTPHFKDAQVVSTVQQVLMSIYMFQSIQMTHYDLHASNVLVSLCSPNTGLLYRLDEQTYFLVPSYGHIVKIIDFGFSYCEANPVKELNRTLKHTDKGFMCHRYDAFADLKLFMISILEDLKKGKRRELFNKMRRICQNVFKGIHVDWENGWDLSALKPPVDILVEEYVQDNLRLFVDDDTWLDTILHLIQTPLSPFPFEDLEESLAMFAQEFSKLEQQIGNIQLVSLCFKQIVVLAKKYRSSFLQQTDPQQREWAVQQFKDGLTQYFDTVAKFFTAPIDYPQLLQSVLSMAHGIEGLFYHHLQPREQELEKQQNKIKKNKVNTALDMFKIVNRLVCTSPHKRYDSVCVMDSVLKQTKWLDLKHVWIGQKQPIDMPTFIYNYYLASTLENDAAPSGSPHSPATV